MQNTTITNKNKERAARALIITSTALMGTLTLALVIGATLAQAWAALKLATLAFALLAPGLVLPVIVKALHVAWRALRVLIDALRSRGDGGRQAPGVFAPSP